MNKLFTKIAALALGATMAVGVGVAVASGNEVKTAEATTAGTAYTISSTAATTITNNGLYVLKQGTNGFTGSIASNWAQTTTTASSYFILKAVGSSTSFTLQDMDDSTKQIYCSAAKKIAWGSTGTTFKFMTGKKTTTISNAVGNDTVGTLQYNSSGGFRPYTSATGADAQLFAATAAATLSSISVSGYTTEFTVGDAFSFGGTVTAHYSDSTTANVTSSTTFSGYNMSTAGNYTVTASYTEGGVTKTATYGITVAAATTPTIVLNGSSFDGFTGQSFSVTATYSNLTSAFAWSTSGSGTTTETITSTGTSTDGTSTYSGTLTGAGTKTLSASGGDATTQNYVITITKTTVSLNKNSTSIAQGKSEKLTATSNAGSSFTWTSSNTSAATVDGGVVSVPSGATVGATSTITATSTVDTSVSATCTVTVTEAPLADVLTSSVIPSAAVGSSTTSWGTASTFSDYTGAIYTGRFMGVSSSSFIGRLNDSVNGYIYTSTVPSNMKLKSVSIDSMTASKTVGVYAQSGAYTAAPSDKSAALGTLTSTSLTYEFDENSNYNAICLRGHSSATEIGVVTIEYEALSTLDSVTTSGQTTSFTAGVKFSYGGTLTAHYTAGKADATVSPASFKFGASGIDPTTSGTAITTNTTLDVATHNGKYIYVVYTEDDITKWASYQITVNYAPVTSVVIDTHAAEIGLNETYDYTLVGVTINTEYAQQGYEWVVSANTVNDDYFFDGSGLLSGDTEGTITLRCRSTADNSKYDELVVTVTGDPTAEFVKASTSGYVGKSEIIEFTYGNIDDVSKITVSSSNTSYVTVANDLVADEGEGLVTINFVAAGSANVTISYDGGETLDTLPVTVSADSVTGLTWSAPTIKVYSGASTTVSDASSWNVHYTMASGDYGSLVYGEFTLKLGGSAITLPHTWDVSDDGKALSIEYGGFTSPTTSTVDVTQTLQAVNASDTSAWDYTFTEKAWSAAGSATLDDKEWTMSGTDDGSPYFGYDATKGQQFGSGSHPYSDLTLSSSDFNGTIASVTVYTSGASSIHATVQVSVGGTAYGDAQTITATNTPYTFDLGGKSGTISIDYVNSSSKAIYIKEIVVNTVSGSHNIANASGHEAAQKAVVKFAKAFNAAMDTTAGCTTNMSSAWSTATTAWNTFTSEAAALGSTEEAYAKNLIKYATAQWTENTDGDYSYCLERAMATYEKCVSSYEMTAFMSTVRPVGRSVNINPISIIGSKSDFNVISIVVITSVISLTAIGGYFFLRKRKENI